LTRGSSDNRDSFTRQLLELLVKFPSNSIRGVLIEPVLSVLDGTQKRLLIISVDLDTATKTNKVVVLSFEAVGVVFELTLRLKVCTIDTVLLGEFFRLLEHELDCVYIKTSIPCDDNAIALPRGFIKGRDPDVIVCVELESNLNLGNPSRR
jgi:hypothetical protein